jgi:hypothetical protein
VAVVDIAAAVVAVDSTKEENTKVCPANTF